MNPVGRGFDSGRGEFYGADEFGGQGQELGSQLARGRRASLITSRPCARRPAQAAHVNRRIRG